GRLLEERDPDEPGEEHTHRDDLPPIGEWRARDGARGRNDHQQPGDVSSLDNGGRGDRFARRPRADRGSMGCSRSPHSGFSYSPPRWKFAMSERSTIAAALTPRVTAITSEISSAVAPSRLAFFRWPSRQPLQPATSAAAIAMNSLVFRSR